MIYVCMCVCGAFDGSGGGDGRTRRFLGVLFWKQLFAILVLAIFPMTRVWDWIRTGHRLFSESDSLTWSEGIVGIPTSPSNRGDGRGDDASWIWLFFEKDCGCVVSSEMSIKRRVQ